MRIEYPKLPVEFKKEWLEALRSGKYNQGHSGLFNKKEGKESHCCLGVACNVAGVYNDMMKDVEWISSNYDDYNIPETLMGSMDLPCKLASMNDGSANYKKKQSFKQIANWIEKNL